MIGDRLEAAGLPPVTVVGQRDGAWIVQEIATFSAPFVLTEAEAAAYAVPEPDALDAWSRLAGRS